MADEEREKRPSLSPVLGLEQRGSTFRGLSRIMADSALDSNSVLSVSDRHDLDVGGRGVWYNDDPMTGSAKRKQQVKMLFFTGVPIMSLVAISLYALSESVQKRVDLMEARQTVFFTVQVGWLIHLLQRERDMSVVYLSTITGDTKTLLADLWDSTDSELAHLPDWLVNVDKNRRREFENKEAFKAHLDRHRVELRVDASLHDEILFYTQPMRVFMNWLTDSIKRSGHGTLWKTLIAYQKLIACKVDAGVERALGELFFSNNGFNSRDDFLWYNKEYHAFRASFALAQNYSHLVTPVVTTRTSSVSGERNVFERIAKFRSVIRYQIVTNESMSMGPYWFSNMTEYLDVLLTIQRDLAKLIFNQINDYIYQTDTNVAASCTMMAIALAMIPPLLKSVMKTTGDIQKYALILNDKTKELKREKQRTDDLLYQMLPKSVADRLRSQKNVEADYYSEVSILFSGMVGFNTMTSELSPEQIVNLLGKLFRLFDEKIELHSRCYKVETIGDKYMVVAGLQASDPEDSHRHACEIADLALEIIKVADLEFEQVPHTGRIKLRIGIHSGPCTAGIVGTKLPRYCLFGDTVNTASRMENSSLANRIQITQDTSRMLARFGGYTMQKRGKINVKGKGEMKTLWLVCKVHVHSVIDKIRQDAAFFKMKSKEGEASSYSARDERVPIEEPTMESTNSMRAAKSIDSIDKAEKSV